MFVDKSRDSRETRTHKLVGTKKDWQEYYTGQAGVTKLGFQFIWDLLMSDNFNVSQYSLPQPPAVICHRYSSRIQHSVSYNIYYI